MFNKLGYPLLGIVVIFLAADFQSASAQRCNTNTLLSNPANCSTYIQCSNGQQIVRPCPPGLHFNPSHQVCDYPSNVNCKAYPVPDPSPNLECYSCTYVEGHTNLSSPNCHRSPISSQHLRKDCFAFGDITVAASIRHGGFHNYTGNVHCVTYTGKSEVDGRTVILRGCENVPSGELIQKKKCFSSPQYDFIFPRLGFVRNVEKCYCNRNGCNGGQTSKAGELKVVFVALLTAAIFSFIYNIVA